jgi:hypothetical protein
MPTRFSTEAANADVMGEDAPPDGAAGGMPKAQGAGTPRERSGPPGRSQPPITERQTSGGAAESGQAKASENIDSAGFVKDKDSAKP